MVIISIDFSLVTLFDEIMVLSECIKKHQGQMLFATIVSTWFHAIDH